MMRPAPFPVPPEDALSIKLAARRLRISPDTVRRRCREHGIFRQSMPGAPIAVSLPALLMLQHGDMEALALLREGRRDDPAVRRYLNLAFGEDLNLSRVRRPRSD